MQIPYATEEEARSAYEHWVNAVDPRVSPTDPRRVTGRRLNGTVVELDVEEHTADSLIADIKGLRDYHWNKGALLPDGGRLQTDVESRANLSGCIAAGNEMTAANLPFSIQWSLGSGHFLSLDLATLKQLGLLQFQHIQAAQSRYAELRSLITPESTTEQLNAVAAIMHEGWPS